MADSSGGIGVLGVLVGALIVIVVGGGILFATGTWRFRIINRDAPTAEGHEKIILSCAVASKAGVQSSKRYLSL
jgi:hypothetical protein